ncbi:MocR-like pyridoxine biosynthesis transcription factor PdxR [Kiloniella sp. b19]|uniref:MocR-like pyridoxine biosynthesis transcription factor PdxR n=1 Tax=Kiloniella sp. GXU_MW_B19 TaxID=3141326 RepID=UPI0031E1366D
MPRQSSGVPLSGIVLDHNASTSLYLQLYNAISAMILGGTLQIGDKLPATREISKELNISRSTVNHAIDLLLSEGFLETRNRSGTYVSDAIQTELTEFQQREDIQATTDEEMLRHYSPRGKRILETPKQELYIGRNIFNMSSPDYRLFPRKLWLQYYSELLEGLEPEQAGYTEPAGNYSLRCEIARHIRSARGIDCEPEQIVVTSGVQQGLNLLAQVLTSPGDRILVENPGPRIARPPLLAQGLDIVPVPVDGQGMNISALGNRAGRLALITPSKQHPLCMPMSLARRMQILNWADEQDGFIVEDDYSSEFGYRGSPLAPLFALDQRSRVIYLGTFSKTLIPALRMGFMILPKALAPIIAQAMDSMNRSVSHLDQQVLARFIATGNFAKHMRKMRKIYSDRQDLLARLLRSELSDYLSFDRYNAGFHIAAIFRDQSIDEEKLRASCIDHGLYFSPLGYYYHTDADRLRGIGLGFAGYTEDEITYGIGVIKRAFELYS